MRVLLVSDDEFTLDVIKRILANEASVLDTTTFSRGLLGADKLCDYDVVLIDLMQSDADYQLLRRLRLAPAAVPVLILSGHAEADPRIKALGFADDHFLAPPLDHQGLIRRIQTIVRHSNYHAPSVIRTGRLVVNLDARAAYVDDRPVHLTPKEFAILELLSRRKGTTLTKQMFLDHLYDGTHEPEMKIIDVFVCKLRKKLALATGGEQPIGTVWGRGYVLCDLAPVRVPRAPTVGVPQSAQPAVQSDVAHRTAA